MRMGAVGLDFLTMGLLQERHTVDEGKYRQLMEHHHGEHDRFKRLFSLGCVPHTDGAVSQRCSARPIPR